MLVVYVTPEHATGDPPPMPANVTILKAPPRPAAVTITA